MNQLPKELQVEIFRDLSFEDKLQSALTCRALYTNIVNTVLYTKIRFLYAQTDGRAQDIIKYMKENGFAYQVLDICMSKMYDPLVLSEIFPNVKSLQVVGWQRQYWSDTEDASLVNKWRYLEYIKEPFYESVEHQPSSYWKDQQPSYSLTMRLFDSPLYITSLTSLSINFSWCSEITELLFIEQLNHAAALENLAMEKASNIYYKNIELLHENAPNLKHLELIDVNAFFVDQVDTLRTFQPLPMNPSIASNLRTFRLSLRNIRLHQREINDMHWIEYICRKYHNLTSVTVHGIAMFDSQQNNDTIEQYLKSAFFNWTQLKTFDMEPIYLSRNILQAMDDCNIRLDNLVAHCVTGVSLKQLVNLVSSIQAMTVNKLSIIEDDPSAPLKHNGFRYFLQLLDKTRRQLKAINIEVSDTVSPIEVLEYIPSLQSLCMFWGGGANSSIVDISQQTTLLTHLDLNAEKLKHTCQWGCATILHIQKIIYASPLLQSISIVYHGSLSNAILDFQQNKR